MVALQFTIDEGENSSKIGGKAGRLTDHFLFRSEIWQPLFHKLPGGQEVKYIRFSIKGVRNFN